MALLDPVPAFIAVLPVLFGFYDLSVMPPEESHLQNTKRIAECRHTGWDRGHMTQLYCFSQSRATLLLQNTIYIQKECSTFLGISI